MSSCLVLPMCHFVSMWWRCWTETYMTIPFEAAHTCWQLTYRVVSLPNFENVPRDTDVNLLFSSDLEKFKWQRHRLCWATHVQWGQIAKFCKRSAWYWRDSIIVQRPTHRCMACRRTRLTLIYRDVRLPSPAKVPFGIDEIALLYRDLRTDTLRNHET